MRLSGRGKYKMKRLLLPLLAALALPSAVNANTIFEYHEEVNPLNKDAVLYPFDKIEDASDWRSYCLETTKKTNNWIESYLVWLEKKLKKEGKSRAYRRTYIATTRKLKKRKYLGCDCMTEKRIIALDTLSKKAADALFRSQENQCFSNY